MYFLKDFHVTKKKKKEGRDQRKIDGYRTADSHRQEKQSLPAIKLYHGLSCVREKR